MSQIIIIVSYIITRIWVLQRVGSFEILTQEYCVQQNVVVFFLKKKQHIKAVLEVLWKGERDESCRTGLTQTETVTPRKVPMGKDLELQGEVKILTFRSEALRVRPFYTEAVSLAQWP